MTKIMIVEDSTLMIAIIKNFVKKKIPDVQFVEAFNGKDAIEKYASERPDLVFMDIKMPEMDGMSALEKIKKIDPGAKIVMVTSVLEEGKRQEAERLGAKQYIMKPFSSADIFRALDEAL